MLERGGSPADLPSHADAGARNMVTVARRSSPGGPGPQILPRPRLRSGRSATRFRALAVRRRAPVAQLDRASDYESEGRTFESFRARHFPPEDQQSGSGLGSPPRLRIAIKTGFKAGCRAEVGLQAANSASSHAAARDCAPMNSPGLPRCRRRRSRSRLARGASSGRRAWRRPEPAMSTGVPEANSIQPRTLAQPASFSAPTIIAPLDIGARRWLTRMGVPTWSPHSMQLHPSVSWRDGVKFDAAASIR
jgi:hypothetical protein